MSKLASLYMKRPQFAQWRPHPWHGLEAGREPPLWVNAYIEITPFDLIKYEVDKASGYLKVDRPQRTSAQPPSLYGFIPRTYCGQKIAALCPGAERGDGDPLWSSGSSTTSPPTSSFRARVRKLQCSRHTAQSMRRV